MLWPLIIRFQLIFRPWFFSIFLLLMRLAIDSIVLFENPWHQFLTLWEIWTENKVPQICHFGHQICIIGRYHEIMHPFEGWYQLRNLVEHHFPFEPGYVTNYFSLLSSISLKLPSRGVGRDVLKICSKFTGEHPCRSGISIKSLCNFIEIALWHGCSPVN